MRVIGVIVFVCAIVASGGCTHAPSMAAASAAPPTRAPSSTSLICQTLLGQFIGLPADVGSTTDGAPAAGRWWVRRCQSELRDGQMLIRFGGPAWFWVEKSSPPFRLRRYVYFRVDAEIRGSTNDRITSRRGVVSLWFRVARATAHVEPVGTIHPTSDNVAASVFRIVTAPIAALNVDDRARRELGSQATRVFEGALRRGFTLIYDINRRQPDFGLGLLPEGVTPAHPFEDDEPWLTNERLIAAPGGVHVLGPFTAHEPLALDARILSGAGLSWRSICAPDLERALAQLEDGALPHIPEQRIRAAGVLSGLGAHQATLAAVDCPVYLVVSTVGKTISHAAIRVRHS